MSSFSKLEYDYHVSLRNSLLNGDGDNLENDKPTIRKSQSNRLYVYYKKRWLGTPIYYYAFKALGTL